MIGKPSTTSNKMNQESNKKKCMNLSKKFQLKVLMGSKPKTS